MAYNGVRNTLLWGAIETKEQNLFIGCFRQHVAFRDSCYQCKYTNVRRTGDITLGDYWRQDPEFSQKGFRGISVIMANTTTGKLWIEELHKTMNLKKTTVDDIKAQQPALRNPVQKPFFCAYDNIRTIKGSVRFMRKYYRGPFKIRLLSFISHSIPDSFSTKLKKIYYSSFSKSK